MSWPSPKSDKGKEKKPEYEDDQSDVNESAHSLDHEVDGFDVPIMRTLGVQKAIAMANEKLRHSTCEKNPYS